MGRIITAREQYHMLAPWVIEAVLKTARYPQEWKGEAPYGRFEETGRARNRPPTVLRDPDDPSAGAIDPSEIEYEQKGDSISAYHPDGTHLGNYSWDEGSYHGKPHIGVAQVNPKFQGQGVAGGIIDHIREHYHPDLVHSGHQGEGSLSYQGRAGALRDLGNTEEEHNDYFNTEPFNYGSSEPARFDFAFQKTDAQQQAHDELKRHYEEDKAHPNFTGETSSGGSHNNPDLYDDYGDPHEYGHDINGDYVGLEDGGKDYEGYSDEGYDYHGYDRNGLDRNELDENGNDSEGFSPVTGVDQYGQTRHGYTPGYGEAPVGTVTMGDMRNHWAENNIPAESPDHQQMMDFAHQGVSPTMYAVRQAIDRSHSSGDHHVGNGDTLYSSLDRAREVAYHPDDPTKDRDIVSVDHLDPDELHTDDLGAAPNDFHYAPVSTDGDAEQTASTPASVVHDPVRQQRMLSTMGPGWSQGNNAPGGGPSMDYTDPNGGRSGQMWQQGNGLWRTEHAPEFGSGMRQGHHGNYPDASAHVMENTRPSDTMDQHAMVVNNDYNATGGGEVSWDPHPSGNGLTATTPGGDLHLTRSPDTGAWAYHAGPHGSQPGDQGNFTSMLPSQNLTSAATTGIRVLNNSPFHGGFGDELGEGWTPHPSSQRAYTRPLPSGNHAYVVPNDDDGYTSGIQRDNGSGQPTGMPSRSRQNPDLATAHAFIDSHENPIPAASLGKGWDHQDMGRREFPSYTNDAHSSGASAAVTWGTKGWQPTVHHMGDMFEGPEHKTPQEAAGWAGGVMNDLGAMNR